MSSRSCRLENTINLRKLFNGRHVYIMNGRHLDYYPSGCGLRVEVVGGIAYYRDKLPSEAAAARMVD
jgi:hypothetical protein